MKKFSMPLLIITALAVANCNFSQKQTASANDSILDSMEIDGIKRTFYLYIPKDKLIPMVTTEAGQMVEVELLLIKIILMM